MGHFKTTVTCDNYRSGLPRSSPRCEARSLSERDFSPAYDDQLVSSIDLTPPLHRGLVPPARRLVLNVLGVHAQESSAPVASPESLLTRLVGDRGCASVVW